MVTLDYQIVASARDGHWANSEFSATATTLRLGEANMNSPYHMFALFPVTIPAGAIITAAYMSLRYSSYNGTLPTVRIYFEDASNPSVVSSESDGNSRTLTTTYTTWQLPVSTSGTWINTDDFSSIIQELVNSYSYASDANIQALIAPPAATGQNYIVVRSWDYSDHSYAPKLHIEYTVGSSASVGLIGSGLCGRSPLLR